MSFGISRCVFHSGIWLVGIMRIYYFTGSSARYQNFVCVRSCVEILRRIHQEPARAKGKGDLRASYEHLPMILLSCTAQGEREVLHEARV